MLCLFLGPRKTGTGRGAKSAEHSEAGSRSDDFALLSHVRGCAPFLVRVDSPSARVERVHAALRGNLCSTHSACPNAHNSHARTLHDVHDACGHVIAM